MGSKGRAWLYLGALAAASAGAVAALLESSRKRRLALVARSCQVTQEAVAELGVPAERIYLPGEGVQLHAVVAGPEDGPLAVLLHGFPECWYSWRHQIPVLARAGYRVVVPDQRGYNLSDKPRDVIHYQIDRLTADILALVRAQGHERANVIGHDWGGLVAWRLAMDYPRAVNKLVVMNAPHPAVFARALRSDRAQRRRSWYVFLFQLPWLAESLMTLSPGATARLLFRGTAVRREAFSDQVLEVMATALAQPGAMEAMVHWYRAAFRHRPAKRARAIETPALLIWGRDDRALGLGLTRGLEEWVTDLQIHYIRGCGHWVQNEAPEEVNQRMISFLDGQVRRAPGAASSPSISRRIFDPDLTPESCSKP